MIVLPTFFEFIVIVAAMAVITGISYWLKRYYLRITQDSAEHTIPHKMRQIVKHPPLWVFIILSVIVMLSIFRGYLPNFVETVIASSLLVVLAFQVSTIVLALISEQSRAVASASFEGKAAKMLVTGLFFLVVLSFKLSFIFWKVVLGVAGKEGGAHMYNPSIYGWSYTKNRERQSDADLP
ncbi:hypothetical protein [Methylophaga sp.]|uniref:hypothetical protein n=1 Tax=Methylophaga sp. TaxID=2024840 RepID=UPI0027196D2D|nr:hypothetical protein [Methylophaga sp.]MDO8826014.1 hypothetical protein [Methylophaga sp.]